MSPLDDARGDTEFEVLLFEPDPERGASPVTELGPGAFLLHGFLPLEAQRELIAECFAAINGPVPGYVPVVRGGGKMHVRMLCLGRHWNGKTYQYESTRTDFDGLPAPPLPERWRALAASAASAVGMILDADLCILNYYDDEGRMGLHQDKDEDPSSIAAGVPVLSVSLGETARFLLWGLRSCVPVETFTPAVGAVIGLVCPDLWSSQSATPIAPGP